MRTAQIKINGGEVNVEYTYTFSSGDRDIPETHDIEICGIYIGKNAIEILDSYNTTKEIYDDITEKLSEIISEDNN